MSAPGRLAQPTEEQVVKLREREPVPWSVVHTASGPLLVNARGELAGCRGIEQLVADAVNAWVAGSHHSEAT